MCGICGFVSKRSDIKDKLIEANNTMFHRGPDDGGVYVKELTNGYGLGLGHRRLSIIDLSHAGHQPMISRNEKISVVFNGEIYNYNELKKQLKYYDFQSNSDTEVIIASYLQWGIDCITHFNGMFALALYDQECETLFLVRDRMGKKPLYYYWGDGELYFASELKAVQTLVSSDLDISINSMGAYLFRQYIGGSNSIYKKIYKVCPGEIVTLSNGELSKQIYWDAVECYKELVSNEKISFNDAKEALNQLITDSVRIRMISDVPVGTFLSGGIDSALVTAIANELSQGPVNSYAIGFYEKEYNEAESAKAIATYLGTKHTELYISEQDMLSVIDDIPVYYDEPFADTSQIPSMLVSKLAKKDVTVSLSGDGGDELFCGYNFYDSVALAQRYDMAGVLLHHILPESLQTKVPPNVEKIIMNKKRQHKTQYDVLPYDKLIGSYFLNEYDEIRYDENKIMFEKNFQKRRMLLDQITYLPDDILCKMDRASMSCSLECRNPLLDYRIVEYSYELPHKFKYKNGEKKYILKSLAYDYIPKELLDRPKKGFGVPIEKWMKTVLNDELLDLSNYSYLKKQGIFKAKETSSFVREYLGGKSFRDSDVSRLIWSFYIFQKWHTKYQY